MTKEEMKKLKETVEAQGTISEDKAKEKAKDAEKVSEEMIEKENTKEEVEQSEEDRLKQEEFDKRQEAEKARDKEFRARRGLLTSAEIIADWTPKTKLGISVKNGEINNIDEILDADKKILESEIIDALINVKTDLILIGQSKGKFGGGKRRAWRQTQRKTKEGNVPTFSAMAVAGDSNGHIGLGTGKSKETLPARDKATRKSKLNIIKIRRACAAFDCDCSELHSIPFKVQGKAGSVCVTLIPAPQGTGLVAANEMKKILKLAGVKDVYTRVAGSSRTTFNLAKATMDALSKTTSRDKK